MRQSVRTPLILTAILDVLGGVMYAALVAGLILVSARFIVLAVLQSGAASLADWRG